jgi:periplasmic protein TonB
MLAALFVGSALLRAADEKSEPPVPVRTVAPEVPQAFARAGGSGLVTVSFLVDEKGQVQDAAVEKSSNPDLNEPAIKAIRKWRFKPARKDGVAVAMRVSIPIKFEVEG